MIRTPDFKALIRERLNANDSESDFLERGRKRGPGRYTATETGAAHLANLRNAARNNKAVTDAAQSQKDFEDFIKGKGVK